MVEALTPNRADKALRVGVLPRRMRRREHFVNAHRRRGRLEALECTIAIADEISRRFVPRKSLAELLRGPGCGRLGGHGGGDYAAAVVRHEQQDEKQPARGRWDEEEIRGHSILDLLFQK